MRERQPSVDSEEFQKHFPWADLDRWGYMVCPKHINKEWVAKHGGGYWRDAYKACKMSKDRQKLRGVWASEDRSSHKLWSIEEEMRMENRETPEQDVDMTPEEGNEAPEGGGGCRPQLPAARAEDHRPLTAGSAAHHAGADTTGLFRRGKSAQPPRQQP